jgi:hypothetical protein
MNNISAFSPENSVNTLIFFYARVKYDAFKAQSSGSKRRRIEMDVKLFLEYPEAQPLFSVLSLPHWDHNGQQCSIISVY